MIKGCWAAAAVVALLSGCSDPSPVGGNADNPLEAAARERGVVQAGRALPVGVFERRHELGRDALCVATADSETHRFALTAAYGAGLVCKGHGTLTDDEGEWTLRFAGESGCSFSVEEEDDELRLPGSLPPACARLCPKGASIAGLRLPRVSWDASDAVAARFDRPDGRDGVSCSR